MATLEGRFRHRWSVDPGNSVDGKGVVQPAPVKPRRWMPFLLGLVAAAAGLGLYLALVTFAVGGPGAASVVDQAGQGVADVGAGLACILLGRRSTGRLRLAWSLIGASALISFAGGFAILVFQQLTGATVPFPSLADALFVGGGVVAILGALNFPSLPRSNTGRGRLAIDGLVIAVSLLFASWALGIGALYGAAHVSFLAGTVALGYPLTDIVFITVLVLAMRRAPRVKLGRLSLLLAGMTAKLVADAGFAVAEANPSTHLDVHLFGFSWITGYALVALAALWPVRPLSRMSEDGPTSLWQMALPWLGMVGAMLTVLVLGVTGHPLDRFLLYPGVVLMILLMASQMMSYGESLRFLNLSREAESTLQLRTKLLNQIVTQAPLGVARTGRDGRFIDANPRLGTLLHAPLKVLAGAMVSEFIVREAGTDAGARYRALHDGTIDTVEEEGQVRRADGSPAWLHWSTTVVRKPDASFDYYLSMAEDATSRHEAEETALANLAGLERLNKMKSEFVSMVSHEFRTALVGIQGFSELIRDDDLEIADIKGLAGDINNDALRLNRMISEMLDLDRMEAGKIRLDVAPVDLNGLLAHAMDLARVSTEQHVFVSDLDLALPLVSGDSDRLIQVISNLLSNAVKYSPDGGEVKVSSVLDGGLARVSVQDHGLGIPAEFTDRVFGRYERFDSNRTAKVAGTGLGLAISRQIVELHGGTIWVESHVARGSTFHFTIPLAGPAPLL